MPIDDGEDKVSFYLSEKGVIYYRRDRHKARNILSVLRNFGTTEKMRAELELLGISFQYPKPKDLLKYLIQIGCEIEGIVLDFFAGSGTICDAVIELNSEDNCLRQSISVQLPEVLDKSGEAYKAGYRTIADITRARIDKVIAKLKAEQPDKTEGLACAHFTLAPSNFKVWRSDVANAAALREQLALFKQAEKTTDSPPIDSQSAMLTELLLKNGLGVLGVDAVSQPMQVQTAVVHCVMMPDGRALWLCFDAYIPALKEAMVQAKPAQVVMLNSCFAGNKADELLSNLKLELGALKIGLLVI